MKFKVVCVVVLSLLLVTSANAYNRVEEEKPFCLGDTNWLYQQARLIYYMEKIEKLNEKIEKLEKEINE